MNSVLICEGSTDYVLLQYYMRKVNGWEDGGNANLKYGVDNKSRYFTKGSDVLTIMSSGGCGNLPYAFKDVLELNFYSKPDKGDAIEQIVIVTDRDDVDTENAFINEINGKLVDFSATPQAPFISNQWTNVSMKTNTGLQLKFQVLVMIIPFAENGAMETFLLNAISASSQYDKQIIEKGKKFVKNADPQKQYLTKRRYITKAEFDAYFCIRTPAEQFQQLQNIVKGIQWEDYPKIQQDFILLKDIGTKEIQ